MATEETEEKSGPSEETSQETSSVAESTPQTEETEGAPKSTESSQSRWPFTFPSAYTILFAILIVVTALAWIILAGRYQLDAEGKPVPGTYHTVERNPQQFISDTLLAPIDGMYGLQDVASGRISVDNAGVLYGSINIALFVLVIGGFLGITMKTGAIDAGIGAAVRRLGSRGELLIPILMIIFMAGGATYGMAEETLAFCAIIITALIALGNDALTGVEAVIDKDRASALLAKELRADLYVMLTDVDAVYVDFGQPTQRALGAASVEEVEQYTFPAGSMGPKVEAACDFARATGKVAVIGSLKEAADLIGGDKGTRITG